MPFAITARLDAPLTDALDRLSRDLCRRAPTAEERPEYPPHLTLAVIDTDELLGPVVAQISATIRSLGRLDIKIGHLGVFTGTPTYLFAAPVVTRSLLALHETVLEALPSGQVHPHHQTGFWVPHITLATLREKPETALDLAMSAFDPLEGCLAALDLVRFPPVEGLAQFRL